MSDDPKYHLYNNPEELEGALLSCVIYNSASQSRQRLVTYLINKIVPDMFADPFCKMLFIVMCEMEKKGLASNDLLSLTEYFSKHSDVLKNENLRTGAAYKISTLGRMSSFNQMAFIDISSFDTILYLFLEKYTRRTLIRLSESTADKAKMGDDVDELLSHLSSSCKTLSEAGAVIEAEDIDEDIDLIVLQAGTPRTRRAGIDTGLLFLNQLLDGLIGTNLYIVGARPSVGKSALIIPFLYNAAKEFKAEYESQKTRIKKTVVLASYEMNSMDIMRRLVAHVSGVDSAFIKTGYCNEQQLYDVQKAADELKDLIPYISIIQPSGKPLGSVLHDAKNMGCGLFIVDYLQLATADKGNQNRNREQEISSMSRALKVFATSNNIPVVALSQLSRVSTTRGDKRPILSDLRESGSIEQDADVVMFIHAPDELHGIRREVLVEKNRHGALGRTEYHFMASIMKWEPLQDNDPQYNDYSPF